MSNSATAIVALVIGLFIGIGLGIVLTRAKNRPVDPTSELAAQAAQAAELATARSLTAEYKAQLEAERAKSEATIKLNAELEAMKARV